MGSPTIIIPARSGSKGWPRKNVTLFDYTAKTIPTEHRDQVIVTTNDESIAGMASTYKFKLHDRSQELSQDRTDIKSVVQQLVSSDTHAPDEIVIMLYLTYPQRNWDDVTSMYNQFVSSGAKSMLCRQPVRTHPCLTMLDNGDGTGTQVIKHRNYQRQQYPACFEISHYMCMFRAGELSKLGRNMYNTKTRYYSIDRVVDVDSVNDYNNFKDIYEHQDQD